MHFPMDIHCGTCLNLGHTFSVRGPMSRMGEMKDRWSCLAEGALSLPAYKTIHETRHAFLIRLRKTATLYRGWDRPYCEPEGSKELWT